MDPRYSHAPPRGMTHPRSRMHPPLPAKSGFSYDGPNVGVHPSMIPPPPRHPTSIIPRYKREPIPLSYHYDEDRGDWVLLGQDLMPHRSSIMLRARVFFAIALSIEISLLAWPATAISIWGIQNAILTLAFCVHLIKAFLLVLAILSNTNIYKMYGRKAYSFFWGIWTRRSHVRESWALSYYVVAYWMQIAVMCTYIVIALTMYPLEIPRTLWWIQWPMGFVSIFLGWVAWCLIISEQAIRKNFEEYVAFHPQRRRQPVQSSVSIPKESRIW